MEYRNIKSRTELILEQCDSKHLSKILRKAIKNGDIDLHISLEDFVKNYNKRPAIGSFEHFIESKFFFSYSVGERIEEFIKAFKNMGLDTTNVEKYRNAHKELTKLQKEIDDYHYDRDRDRDYDIEDMYNMLDDLEAKHDLLENEMKKLHKEANKNL
jgi:hypothetical protein